jgi:hypothetical protein
LAQRLVELQRGRRCAAASSMITTDAQQILDQFRRELYHRVLGRRKDTLFELMEATFVSPGPTTLVRLTLTPVFQRRWSSAPDALADGTLDVPAGQKLLRETLTVQPQGEPPLWVLDGTIWPRPAAQTSPERTWGYRVAPGIPQQGVVPAWEYQWLVVVPETTGSWVLPLDVTRRGPQAGTPTELAITQLQTALAQRPVGASRPVVLADSQYDPIALARTDLDVDLLIRLNSKRQFYRKPPPYSGKGAPRKHGPVFKLRDPDTHGPPERQARVADPSYGTVTVTVWTTLHAQGATDVSLTVVRIQVDHLPHSGRRPKPLWLVWVGGPLPDDLLELWRWYCRRFTVEHAFRFCKQELGWTSVRPRAPEAADRWTWLMALDLWQLWLARAVVTDQRLPWERPLPPERLTPGRVCRVVGTLLAALGSPVRPVRTRGKSPGRQTGERPGRRRRYPVVKRATKTAA